MYCTLIYGAYLAVREGPLAAGVGSGSYGHRQQGEAPPAPSGAKRLAKKQGEKRGHHQAPQEQDARGRRSRWERQQFDTFHGEISCQPVYALSLPAGGRNARAFLTDYSTSSSKNVVGVRALSCYQHWKYFWILAGYLPIMCYCSAWTLSLGGCLANRNEMNLLFLIIG